MTVAIFKACIGNSDTTNEIKYYTWQYLEGEALKAIKGLGHSAAAYILALEVLEQKFEGNKRQTTLYLDQVDKFCPLQSTKLTELDRFSDLLNILCINLVESDREKELGNGVLYIQLQKKLPVGMLAQYHRWVHDKSLKESVNVVKNLCNLSWSFRR